VIPPSDNAANGIVAGITASPAYIFAMIDRSDAAIAAGIILPVIFFIVGKTVDVLVRLYLANRGKSE
jgi:hypothetical protein